MILITLLFSIILANGDCNFGYLSQGALSWGIDLHNKTIPLSTMNSNNGTESIQNFVQIFENFNRTISICFQSKKRICSLSYKKFNGFRNFYRSCSKKMVCEIKSGNNFNYGPLRYGAIIWGFDYENKWIFHSFNIVDNGNESISTFTSIYEKFDNAATICFNPKRTR